MLVYICNFDMKLLFHPYEADWGSQALLDRLASRPVPYTLLTGDSFDRVKQLFDSMWAEYNDSNVWRHLLLKTQMLEVLVLLDRSLAEVTPELRPSLNPSTKERSVWPVIAYIQQHYREPIALTDLAERFHFHSTYLSERIKKQLGITFLDFIHDLRLRHACSLLLATDLPVTAVSLEAGFGSFQTFSRVFRKSMQMTPAAYRLTSKASQTST
ncbi:helix-turn-helix domain-containing protein [Paenibacillus koleovorans]|uniref:helix-turn-helix domain-containing protein n=1 Tax=Paenibacillus koleovorans TaxID=121608 RepID=UPI000FD9C005|nr:AraC family transcriptional regulator [Paenibacillus koleovorans]